MSTTFHIIAFNPQMKSARCTIEFQGEASAPPIEIQDERTNRVFHRTAADPNDTGHWEYHEKRPYTVELVYDQVKPPAPAQEELLDDRDEIEV